jgi:small subunit ribosomal protein S7
LLDVFHDSIRNISPQVEVRSRRVGGANYQIPTEVRPERARSLALRWLVNAANDRSDKSFDRKLAGEILDAIDNRGTAIKKKEDSHRMAEANRAFAHFRW